MKPTTTLMALFSLSLLLLAGCSGAVATGSPTGVASPKPQTAKVAPASGCIPGRIPVGEEIHTTAQVNTPVTLIGGRCFDTIAYAGVGVSSQNPTGKAVLENFCTKLGFDDQLASFLGHGLLVGVASELNSGSQTDGGHCVYSPENDLDQALIGLTSNRISIEWSTNQPNSQGPQDALTLYDQQVEQSAQSEATLIPTSGVGDEATTASGPSGVAIAAYVGNGYNSVYVQVGYTHYGGAVLDVTTQTIKPWAIKALAIAQEIHGDNN